MFCSQTRYETSRRRQRKAGCFPLLEKGRGKSCLQQKVFQKSAERIGVFLQNSPCFEMEGEMVFHFRSGSGLKPICC